jgi:L-fucose mutarotase
VFCYAGTAARFGIDGPRDEVALVDCNFPAASTAQRLVRLDGAHLPAALEACIQLLPLDTFVDKPALRMMQVHAPDDIPEVQQECQRIIVEGKLSRVLAK